MSSVEAEGGACLSLLQFERTAFTVRVGHKCFAKHLHKK